MDKIKKLLAILKTTATYVFRNDTLAKIILVLIIIHILDGGGIPIRLEAEIDGGYKPIKLETEIEGGYKPIKIESKNSELKVQLQGGGSNSTPIKLDAEIEGGFEPINLDIK